MYIYKFVFKKFKRRTLYMPKDTLIFPDINCSLCPEQRISLTDSISIYRKELIATNTWYNLLYANKLKEYQMMIQPRNLANLNKLFNQYINHINNWKKKQGYSFIIKIIKRVKSYKKWNEKTRLFLDYQNEEELQSSKYALSRIRDGIGLRLIIDLVKTDTIDSIRLCYELMNETIRFFTEIKEFIPEWAEPKLFTGFDSKKYPDIIIPTDADNCFVLKGYENNVKDYIKNPKANGYQSLHIVFRTESGQPFEIQIRTIEIDKRVEELCAPHDAYDKERYPEHLRISLDRENINIFGYSLSDDLVGLEKSVDPFNTL